MNNKIVKFILAFLALTLPVSNVINQYIVINLELPNLFFLWKDVIFLGLSIYAIIYLLKNKIKDRLSILIISLVVLINIFSLISTYINSIPLELSIIGYRFEVLWISLLGILFVWSKSSSDFNSIFLYKYILIGFWLNLIYSISAYVSNLAGFNFSFGKGDVEYAIISNSCHQIDIDNSICRLSGAFNHPNHLASYILLVLPLFVYFGLINIKYKYISLLSIFFGLVVIYLTDSKSSWIACLFLALVYAVFYLSKNNKIKKQALIASSIVGILSSSIFLILNNDVNNLPEFIKKSSSTYDHIVLSKTAQKIIINDFPSNIITGYGLGETGSAAKEEYRHFNDSAYFKKNEDFFYQNILPLELSGVTENWYYQLILNGGILYAILYISLLLLIIYNAKNSYLVFGLIPLIFVNSVLHTFESSIVVQYIILLTILSNTINNYPDKGILPKAKSNHNV